jgi:cytochrome c551
MKKAIGLILGASILLGACGGGNGDNSSNKTAKNGDDPQQIYNNKCISCHGENLKGGIGPSLQKVGSKYSKDEILNILKNGRGQMPPKVVQGEDAEKIAEWLSQKK